MVIIKLRQLLVYCKNNKRTNIDFNPTQLYIPDPHHISVNYIINQYPQHTLDCGLWWYYSHVPWANNNNALHNYFFFSFSSSRNFLIFWYILSLTIHLYFHLTNWHHVFTRSIPCTGRGMSLLLSLLLRLVDSSSYNHL